MKKRFLIKKNKVVFFQGTFEILNYGHVKAFELCKTWGDYLIIGLNTDKLVRSYKHRDPCIPFKQKKFILESIKWVDKVVPAPNFSPMKLLKKLNVDVYVIGYEWIEAHKEEIDYIKSKGGEIRITPDFGATRTSQIKEILLKEAQKSKK